MAKTRIGLLGFGRVGRNLFRAVLGRSDLAVTTVRDVADAEVLEYLLRYDTVLGRFPEELSVKDGHLYVAGRQIAFLTGEPDAPGVDWGAHGVDVVVDATSRDSVERAELDGHLERGASAVVLCVPPAQAPDATVVMGVNDEGLDGSQRIVSNASCTAHCVAPILQILDQAFGVERAFVNSVHAYTNKQRLADVPAEDPRSGRAAAENIIPQETKTAQIIEDVLPSLAGKVQASAMNVPVSNGSVVDLVCWHERDVTPVAINEVVRTAVATARYRDLVEFATDPIVSSDILQSPYSSTFDSIATTTLGTHVSKTLAWFDNGWGYVHRVADLIERLGINRPEGAEGAAA